MDNDKTREKPKPIVLKPGDRESILVNIPKPGRDFTDCCYTACTRCS